MRSPFIQCLPIGTKFKLREGMQSHAGFVREMDNFHNEFVKKLKALVP